MWRKGALVEGDGALRADGSSDCAGVDYTGRMAADAQVAQSPLALPHAAQPAGAPLIHVVIVDWNLPEDTLACVRSLLDEGMAPESLWVVDNGSHPEALAQLVAGLPTGANLLRSEANLGFAGGNNLGIRAALAAGAEWTLLLNNDTLLQPGMLHELSQARALAPDVRLWSALVVYHAEPTRVWTAGDRRILGTLLTRSVLNDRPVPAQLPRVLRVDSLAACALLVHAEVWRAIGLFDTRYFMYGEDGDLCLRAARAGFTLACAPFAVVEHKVSLSTPPLSARARRWRAGNMARFYRTHTRGLQRWALFVLSLLRTLLVSLVDLAAGRREAAAAAWQGWRAGWFGDPEIPVGRPAPDA